MMTAADALIMMGIFEKFSRYLAKLAECFTKMEKAAVSVGRVAQLLNIPECRSLMEHLNNPPCPRSKSEQKSHIDFSGVEFQPPQTAFGLGPMGELRLSKNQNITVPLGKFVSVL